MPIDFNPSISFKADSSSKQENSAQKPLSNITSQKPDEFVKTSNENPEAPGSVDKNQDNKEKAAANITPYQYAKSYIKNKAQLDPMSFSIAKGIIQGTILGTGFLGISWICNVLPKISKKGPNFTEVLKHPLKYMDKSNKILAGIAGVLMLGYNIFAGHVKTQVNTNSNENA